MKINIFKTLIFFLSSILIIIIYLSFIGIETEKFNQQIKEKIVQSNKDLDIDLKTVKLTLDPLKLRINVKTVGAIIYYLNRPLELEYIQTRLSLDSVFKNKLVSSNFKIVTRSILLKDLVKFIRSIEFRPELLILETIIKDGFINLNLNLNLDENGMIKNDYEVNGILKEGKIKFLNNFDFEKINFLFILKEKNFLFKNVNFSTDGMNFYSDLLKIIKKKNKYVVEGEIENSKSILSKKIINLINFNLQNLNFEKTKFSSKNNFKFEIDNRFKFKNFKINSYINVNQISYKKETSLSNYFPDLKNIFYLNDHDLNLKYEKNILLVNGKGKIKNGNNSDQIRYFISKNNDDFEFETDLNIKKTSIKNHKILKNSFPLSNELIDLKNHKLKVKYKNNKLYLNGEGGIKFENGFENIKYFLVKNNDDYELKTEIDLKNISLKNHKYLKDFFPSTKDLLNFKNHKIKIEYKKNFVSFSGKGQIKIDREYDNIDYFILKEANAINFDVKTDLSKTDFKIGNINYKKNKKFITKLNLSGSFIPGGNLSLNNLSILEKKNKIKISNLVFDENYLIINLDEADFDYVDNQGKENQFLIKRTENNKYTFNGLFFNANTIVTNLLEGNENQENKFFKNNLNIVLSLNKVNLDEINFVNSLQGSILIKDNKVVDANLSANFDSNSNIIFTIDTKDNSKKITKLYSSKAKPLVNRYKFIKGFDEGYLDFESTKTNNKSRSNLKIYDFKLKEIPTLTKLLTLASLQGIADILTGEGIRFNEFEMKFNNEGNLMTIDEIYAIGPAISILMDGYVEKDELISLRGTLVPATTINKTVSKIPLLGKILVGKKTGEGVFGVSFKIKGSPKNLETNVNPIKTLTPRFITRTLEKLKKN